MINRFFQLLGVTILLLGYVIIMADTIQILAADNINTIILTGKLATIKQRKYRGNYSYYIYLLNTKERFVIGGHEVGCFDYGAFQKKVRPHQTVYLRLMKRGGLLLPADHQSVIDIMADNMHYLNMECVKIEAKKLLFWLASGPFILFFVIWLLYKKHQVKQIFNR
ncbi:hypothetical protein GCM10027037_06180 [Mucilaginibacter koreensis]